MIDATILSMLALSTVHEPQEAPDDACATWLQRVESVSAARDFTLESNEAASGLTGRSSRGSRLEASCEPGYAQLRLVDAEGASVILEFSGEPGDARYSFQMSGDFPGLGQIARTHVVERVGSEIEGFTNFSATTADDFASVDLAPDGSTTRFVGEAARANSSWAPRLASSSAWKDANLLLYGIAGLLDDRKDAADGSGEAAMESLFSIAVPTPQSEARDADDTFVLRVCSASGSTCVLALFFAPAATGCLVATAGCLAALGCWEADCSGDDAPATM